MADRHEHVASAAEAAARAERELRYSLAAPLIAGAALWCDLAGPGAAAAAGALASGATPVHSVLVGSDSGDVEQAQRELRLAASSALTADLSDAADLERVRAELLEHAGDGVRCVTCFEVLQDLSDFAPLVRLLSELAEAHDFTVVLSVPNDAFWPRSETASSWGEGAFEELRRLLPAGQTVLAQIPLQGSALAPADGDTPELRAVDVEVDPDGVASHFVVAFGPERERVAAGARVVQADLEDERRSAREREAELGYLREHVRELERRLGSGQGSNGRGA
jgi:hypothetical protein